MKKILSVFLTVWMIAAMCCMFAFGASGSLSATSVSGKPGDTVDVSISLNSNPGIVALMLKISYDSSLTLTKITNGAVFSEGDMTPGGDMNSNPYNVSWGSYTATSNNTKTGKVVTLTFSISKNATAGQKKITITADADNTFDKNFTPVSFSSATGTVTVSPDQTPSITVSPSTLNIRVGESGTATYTTVPAGQTVGVSIVSLSHTSYSQGSGKVTFTGKSIGTDIVDLTMNYNGQTYKARITVNVTDPPPTPTLSSIAVTTKPTKTTYHVGETLNTAGMVVQATYSDGTKANVTGWTCSPTTLSTAGTQTITVTYMTKSTTFPVNVLPYDPNPVKCTLKLNPASLTIANKDIQRVTCSYTLTGDTSSVRSITIRYKNHIGGLIDCKFEEWDGNSIPLKITANKRGSGTVDISILNTDTEEVLAEETLEVTVRKRTFGEFLLDILSYLILPFYALFSLFQ